MKLITLGTGTVTPHPHRTSACHWVEAGPVRLLMDCGAGALHRLAEFRLPWMDITHVAITHFHADHWGELAALIFAMKYGTLQPRSAPLPIIGPVGMKERMDRLAAAFGDWVTDPGFPLEVVEIAPRPTSGAPRTIALAPGVELSCCKTPHTDESLAYSVQTSEARLVYTGDTGPSDELGDWARDCDVLLAECSLPDSMAMDLHLTPRRAGALAARAHAKRLVLTHLYPPVEAVNIVNEARGEYGGSVSIARDGDPWEIVEGLRRYIER